MKRQTWRIIAILAILGLAIICFVTWNARFNTSVTKSRAHSGAEAFLRELYPQCKRFRDEHGRWPTSADLSIIRSWVDVAHKLHPRDPYAIPEMDDTYWTKCILGLQTNGEVIAFVPSGRTLDKAGGDALDIEGLAYATKSDGICKVIPTSTQPVTSQPVTSTTF